MFIAFIAKVKHDKYKAFVGKPIESEGDNDSFISILGSSDKFDSEELAIAFIRANSKNIKEMYPKAIQASDTSWLSVIKSANPDGPIALEG